MKKDPKYRGKVQVRTAKNYNTPFHLRRPTGILGLDLALNGGFPAGGASQVYGPRSTGKTHLVFRVAGEVQQNYGEDSIIALGMSELRADIGFARNAGFCVAYSNKQISQYEEIRAAHNKPPFTEEELADLRKQIGQVIILHGTTGGDMLESTIEVLRDLGSACQLIIVDSLGSLLTPAQDEGTVSAKHYGGSSGIITAWQTKVQPLYINDQPDGSMLETTILGINQVRALIGGPKPNMVRPAAGAKAWEHAQLINLKLTRGKPIYSDTKHVGPQKGHIVHWSIEKGKAGTHDGIRGEYDWRHIPDGDPVFWTAVQRLKKSFTIDIVQDLVESAKSLGVVDLSGAWLSYKDERGGILCKANGIEAFADKIEKDPELHQLLYADSLLKADMTVQYR